MKQLLLSVSIKMCKMKQHSFRLILVLQAIIIVTMTHAYDFSAVNDDGVRIYYIYINGGLDVAVINNGMYGNDYHGNVNIPEEVTYKGKTMVVRQIGNHAFFESKVESVTIPKSVECIDKSAFRDCFYLKEVFISEGVLRIESRVFENCYKLRSIVIPNSVITIGERTFENCKKLSTISLSNNISELSPLLFKGCSSLTNIEIPNSVTMINRLAFENCSELTFVDIPNSVTSIRGAFSGCTSLKKITIPNSVEELGGGTFYGCTKLTDVVLPENIGTIEGNLFSGCVKLANIDLSHVGRILENAFYNCRSLTSITIGVGNSIGANAFEYCTNLASVIIKYGDDDGYYNTRYIGERAFYCERLMSVVCLINFPQTIKGISDQKSTFHPNTFNKGTLYVPNGSLERYKNTQGWRDFKNIIEVDPTDIRIVEISKNEKTPIFDLSGRVIKKPHNGINIVKGKKYVVK